MKRPKPFGSYFWREHTLYLDYRVGGKRIRKLFATMQHGTKIERGGIEQQARDALDELAVLIRKAPQQFISSLTFPTYKQAALFYLEKCYAEKSYVRDTPSYFTGEQGKLAHSMAEFGDRTVDQISTDDVWKLRTSLRGKESEQTKRPWTDAYVNRVIASIGQVYHFCKKQEIWVYDKATERERQRYGDINQMRKIPNPIHGLGKLTETPKETQILTLAQFQKFYQEISDPAVQEMVVVDLYTGLRFRNIVKLERSQIDFDAHVIRIPDHKGKKYLVFDMHTRVEWAIRRAYERAADRRIVSKWVWSRKDGERYRDIRSALEGTIERAEVPRITFKSLRTTCATWLYEVSGDMNLSRDMLGHTNVRTTDKHYVQNKAYQASKRANQMLPDFESIASLVSNL